MAEAYFLRGVAPDAVRPVVLERENQIVPPTIDYFVATDEWVLREDYVYRGGGLEITVPAGFTLDLASIPRPLRGLINSFELGIASPLLHDYLYSRGGRVPGRALTRAEVDRLFLAMMEEEGVPRWRRLVAYAAVRALGWAYWRDV